MVAVRHLSNLAKYNTDMSAQESMFIDNIDEQIGSPKQLQETINFLKILDKPLSSDIIVEKDGEPANIYETSNSVLIREALSIISNLRHYIDDQFSQLSESVIFVPKQRISFADALKLQREIVEGIDNRKERAREAEARYWKLILDADED